MDSAPPLPVRVRPAVPADLSAVADTLADAFTDYRFTRWALPADGYPERLRAVQHYFTERVGLPYGRVWTTDGVLAAAVWTVPGVAVPAEVFADPALAALYGDRAEAVARLEEELAPHRPAGPAWFLATVGVRRDAQGKGVGTAVLSPGLAAADADGFSCYLETSDARNVRFYRRLGFEVTAEVTPSWAAPRTWCMVRPAPASRR